jgi:hypothetical protein
MIDLELIVCVVQASTTKLVNKMLLQNILPQHVAEIYLSR